MRAFATLSYGAPDVLTPVERPDPVAGDGEVLVAVEAVAVTRGDERVRAADFPGAAALIGRAIFGLWRPRQAVQGTMFAGRIVALGRGVTRFAIGDRVFGEVPHGANAELLVVREDSNLALIPAGWSASEVAALPYGALCAWIFLTEQAELRAGQHIVVMGAGGGVGRYAVQLAQHLGARVSAVAGPRHDTRLIALGLGGPSNSHRILRDRSEVGDDVDVVLDTTGSTHLGDWRPHLVETGRFVTCDMSLQLGLDLLLAPLRSGPTVHFGVVPMTPDKLAQVAQLLAEGAIRPVLDRRFRFDDMVAAHAYLHTARPNGDIVVEVRPPVSPLPLARTA